MFSAMMFSAMACSVVSTGLTAGRLFGERPVSGRLAVTPVDSCRAPTERREQTMSVGLTQTHRSRCMMRIVQTWTSKRNRVLTCFI